MNDGTRGDQASAQAIERGIERAIEHAITGVLARRAPGASACPSEVARSLSADQWRPLMPAVRRVAATLALQGRLLITQRGTPVDPQRVLDGGVRGPLRLKLTD
jgi:hypothetical protein